MNKLKRMFSPQNCLVIRFDRKASVFKFNVILIICPCYISDFSTEV